MKKITLPVFCIYLIFIVLAGCANPAMPANKGNKHSIPVVWLSETHHEFEPVLSGNIVIHDFTIKNTGSAVLILSQVNTG